MRNNEPENFGRCRKVLLPKDYVRFRLSGTFATEVSDASGMLLLDIRKRDWSDEILSALHIDRSLLADCHESQEVTAQVSEAVEQEVGIPAGTPIVGRRRRPGGGRRRQRHRAQRRHQRHHRHQRRRLRLQRPRGHGPARAGCTPSATPCPASGT